ncbi:MAG: WecB/TagA/CpsF family glycosyltransferase [Verrucomicrobiota bacterium JB022]|nr:WecB/TagA/CpsF family glycosyltransferase [Verrucomicrobiota bacterium JB022]
MTSITDNVIGINFFHGTCAEAIERASQGGLVVAPSGPGLAQDWPRDPVYQRALLTADMVLADSGYLALCWQVMSSVRLTRISGLNFFGELIRRLKPEDRTKGRTFWVMPNEKEGAINLQWLGSQGIEAGQDDSYNAPKYSRDSIADPALAAILNERRPAWVFLNLGGGVQEQLGYWLREHLDYRPTIICTGAAIAFLSGQQASIPMWADRLYLGWLIRSLRDPKRHGSRYWNTLHLPLVLWHGSETARAAANTCLSPSGEYGSPSYATERRAEATSGNLGNAGSLNFGCAATPGGGDGPEADLPRHPFSRRRSRLDAGRKGQARLPETVCDGTWPQQPAHARA